MNATTDPATRRKWYRTPADKWTDFRWQRLTDRERTGLELARCTAKTQDSAEWLDDRHFTDSMPMGYGDTLDALILAGFMVRGPDGQPMLEPDEWNSMQRAIDPSGTRRMRQYRERQKAAAPRPHVVGATA